MIKKFGQKLIALPVFLSLIFNGLSFFVFESGPKNFYCASSVSFSSAQAASNPLNAVNDLMKKEQSPQEKPETTKNGFGQAQDFAHNDISTASIFLSSLKIQFLQNNSCFIPVNTALAADLDAPPERTKYDFAGVLCLFAFLLMYFALLKEGWNANNSLFINKTAAA
ncbi:MAG: hypothetical protein LBU09_03360 [Endomicrobium sp.]|jgi:hypothetical protein|nr:hypothetical protein [Endomicrobium sp.]